MSNYTKVKPENDKRRVVSVEQRHQLLQVYLILGRDAAERECVALGLQPNYAAHIAAELGLAHRHTRRPNR